MSNPIEIKQCPFCGGEPDIMVRLRPSPEGKYYLRCVACLVCGGARHNKENAIAAWNHRHPDQYSEAALNFCRDNSIDTSNPNWLAEQMKAQREAIVERLKDAWFEEELRDEVYDTILATTVPAPKE